MTAIHEFSQILWVTTPFGDGVALFIVDYGPHENTVWCVALETDGVIKHFSSEQIKMCYNHTFGINVNKNQ